MVQRDLTKLFVPGEELQPFQQMLEACFSTLVVPTNLIPLLPIGVKPAQQREHFQVGSRDKKKYRRTQTNTAIVLIFRREPLKHGTISRLKKILEERITTEQEISTRRIVEFFLPDYYELMSRLLYLGSARDTDANKAPIATEKSRGSRLFRLFGQQENV
jgi:hypothetical protein